MVTINNDSAPILTHSIEHLRQQVQQWHREGHKVAFVPTMGALHFGHLSLVELARQKADKTIASIFVNPAQFAPHEDLATYPRQEEDDLNKLAGAGCDSIYLPNSNEMYPGGFSTSINVDDLSSNLCGISRPHFFSGVATVVCKLLNQCTPDFAIFGEKDYQQLLVIMRMVRDLDIPVEIVSGAIVRESDGLAMSSRNAYLSDANRKIAGQLNTSLQSAISILCQGAAVKRTLHDTTQSLRDVGFDELDYLEIRSGTDLSLYGPGALSTRQLQDARIFAAVLIGKIRLIDNMKLKP